MQHPTAPQPVDVRLIGGDAAVRALAESIAAAPGSSPASYAPSRRGEGLRAYLSVVVDPADPPAESPLVRAERAKRNRDILGEVGALMDGENALRTAPWYPLQTGDILHVHYEATPNVPEVGEAYLVEQGDGDDPTLRLLAAHPADEAGCPGVFAPHGFWDMWFEAGAHRITLVRTGRVLHDGPGAPDRDGARVSAPAAERHGVPLGGGPWPECICHVQPCGGTREADMRDDCPEHRRSPVLSWHRAENCHRFR